MIQPWRLIPGLLCLTLASMVLAQQLPAPPADGEALVEEPEEEIRRYSVEIIVFEYADSSTSGNEIFEPDPPPEGPFLDDLPFGGPGEYPIDGEPVVEYGDFIEMPAEAEELDLNVEIEEVVSLTSVDFRLLEDEEMTMAGIHEKLLTLDAYQPVLWGGWSQAVVDVDLTPPVRLRILGSPPLSIDGTLTLYLKNYLHLIVALTMQQQLTTIEPGYAQTPPREPVRYGDSRTGAGFGYDVERIQTIMYEIDEDRIFRSGELRYYDHPKFGVLARVHRVEEAEEEDPSDDGPRMLSSNTERQ